MTAGVAAAVPASAPALRSKTPALIAFVSPTTVGQYMVRSDGTGLRSLDLRGSWSPSGKEIASIGYDPAGTSKGCGVWVTNLRTGKALFLAQDCVLSIWSPSWSPDGSRLAWTRIYCHNCPNGGDNLNVVRVDGKSAARNLTNDPVPDKNPTWSPDSKTILFWKVDYSDPTFTYKPTEVFAIGADGSNERRLTTSANQNSQYRYPAYSPDGTRILFSAVITADQFTVGDENIYVMNADGTNVQQLTTAPGSDEEAAWSPDGTQIAFVSDRLSHKGSKPDVFVMNADGTNQHKIATTGRLPQWLPAGALTSCPRC